MTIKDYISAKERLEHDLHEDNKWSCRFEAVAIGLVFGFIGGLVMLVW